MVVLTGNVSFPQGYRLDFNEPSDFWGGCPSTVVPDPGEHVWGALWRLTNVDLNNLDRQEGVPEMYLPFDPDVQMPDGENVSCRCYMLVNQPVKRKPLPLDRRPSKSYLQTMLLGAKESNLPSDYCKLLEDIPDNGNDGPIMPWSNHH